MKKVTAKEFQQSQSKVMKEVAAGAVYQITFHGKPFVELHPVESGKDKVLAGSQAAFRESLAISLTEKKSQKESDYKVLRRQSILDRYGD